MLESLPPLPLSSAFLASVARVALGRVLTGGAFIGLGPFTALSGARHAR